MFNAESNHVFLLVLNVAFFIFSVFLSTVLYFLLYKFASTLGIRNDSQNVLRWSSLQKPALGGITFFIVFLIGLVFIRFFYETSGSVNNIRLMGVFFSVIIGFTLGLFDDAYNTRAFIKFFAQVFCAIILILTGNYIKIFNSELLNYLITIFWVVGIMNAINMLDNMDAITTIVALFIFIFLLIKMKLFGMHVSPNFLVFVGVIASLLSFLYFNAFPSKIYMGDTGSQFLGVLLAVVGINYYWNSPDYYGNLIGIKQFFMAIIVFSLPIIDTTTVFVKRISKGKSPFIGGKDHTTHHLAYLGLSSNQVALVFAGISLLSGIVCITILFVSNWTLLHTIIYTLYFLSIFLFLFIIAFKNQKKAS